MTKRNRAKAKKYAAKSHKAVKKLDKDIQKDAESVVELARSFFKDTTDNAGKIAFKGVKYIKREGKKDFKLAKKLIKENPAKSGALAISLAAALSYFFISRKKIIQ
jgi:hypothetical protein